MRLKRLSGRDRDRLVSKILDDIPTINYNEQINELLSKVSKEQLPVELKAAIKADSTILFHVYLDRWKDDTGYYRDVYGRDFQPTNETQHEVMRLNKLREDQASTRRTLKSNLRNALMSITTVKQLLEVFPEFAKYVVVETETLNLPAPVIVTDLMKAGWKG